MRIETCFYISGIGMFGYLIFSSTTREVWFDLLLAIFFCSALGYAYNHITDREEDIINNKRVNYFAEKPFKGYAVMLITSFLGMYFALNLPARAFLLYVLGIFLILSYSGLRVKKLLLVKNIYTGVTIALAFLIGAYSAGAETSSDLIFYFLLAFVFGLTLNVLGDIRGYDGDKTAGVRTIPVVYGLEAGKRFAYFLLVCMVFLSIYVCEPSLLLITPFAFMIAFFVKTDNHRGARYSLLISFIILPVFHAMIKALR